MLDSEFVRSVSLFADPTRRSRAVSTSDQDSHRPASPSRGVGMPEVKTSVASSTDEGCPATRSVVAAGTAQPTNTTENTTTTAQRTRNHRVT